MQEIELAVRAIKESDSEEQALERYRQLKEKTAYAGV